MNNPRPAAGERPPRQYSFAGYTLDREGGFLRRAGEEIALRPKSFAVLVCLVERHGRIVNREELIQLVWIDVSVADESVTKCITDIRKAFGDDGRQLIRTVAGRGYLFAAPVATLDLEWAYPASAEGTVAVSSPAATVPRQRRRIVLGSLAVVAVAAFALLAMWGLALGK